MRLGPATGDGELMAPVNGVCVGDAGAEGCSGFFEQAAKRMAANAEAKNTCKFFFNGKRSRNIFQDDHRGGLLCCQQFPACEKGGLTAVVGKTTFVIYK